MGFQLIFSSSPDESSDGGDTSHLSLVRAQGANPTDEDLLEAAGAGDEKSFRELFNRYAPGLHEFAMYYVKSPDVADDVVAEVFAALWSSRVSPTSIKSARAYLFGAVRNRASNILLRERQSRNWTGKFSSLDSVPAHGEPAEPPDVHIERQESISSLLAALDILSERARTVVWLRWIRQLSFEEIAEATGTTTAAVHMQHSRALRVLKEHFKKG